PLMVSFCSPASGLFCFQAEDGIRDFHVTGVQTCALPIYSARSASGNTFMRFDRGGHSISNVLERNPARSKSPSMAKATTTLPEEIGRASCREREWICGGWVGL